MSKWVLHSELSFIKVSGSHLSRFYHSSKGQKVKFQAFLKLQQQNEKGALSKNQKFQRTKWNPKSKIVSICLKCFIPNDQQPTLVDQICMKCEMKFYPSGCNS